MLSPLGKGFLPMRHLRHSIHVGGRRRRWRRQNTDVIRESRWGLMFVSCGFLSLCLCEAGIHQCSPAAELGEFHQGKLNLFCFQWETVLLNLPILEADESFWVGSIVKQHEPKERNSRRWPALAQGEPLPSISFPPLLSLFCSSPESISQPSLS